MVQTTADKTVAWKQHQQQGVWVNYQKGQRKKINPWSHKTAILRNSKELSYKDSVDLTRIKTIKDTFIARKQHFCSRVIRATSIKVGGNKHGCGTRSCPGDFGSCLRVFFSNNTGTVYK